MINERVLAAHFVKILTDLRERPLLYLTPFQQHSLACIDAFLIGMHATAKAINAEIGHTDDAYRSMVSERGWDDGTTRGEKQLMFDRGMSEQAIIDELIFLELESWKRRYAMFEAQSEDVSSA